MKNLTEHPVAQLLDGVASRGRPTSDELDQLARDLTNTDEPGPSMPEVRRSLSTAVEQVIALRDEGSAKAARDLARESTYRLVERLPEYVEPSKSDGQSMADIIATIPR